MTHRNSYIIKTKKYFIDDLDMERVAYKKVNKIRKKLTQEQGEVFVNLFSAISKAIDWKRFSFYI